MIRWWMHRWERWAHNREDNRQALPFEWGLECLRERDTSLDPRRSLGDFVSDVLSQSDAFFTPPRPTDFSFRGQRLEFPSPVQSPWPENNVARGRLFPTESGGRAVIVLPHWNANEQSYVALCRLMSSCGLTALRLTLPYHEARKPPHLERSEYMISPNIGLTIQACRQAVLETRLAADWLERQGYRQLGVIGTSIGSCVAFLMFAHDERFRVGIFNHASSYFADVVWTGLTTQHVRQGLEQNVTLDELRRFWSIISPQTFVPRLRRTNRKLLVISGRYDLSFLPHLTDQFLRELERWEVPFEKAVLPCGHYSSGRFPFKYIDGFFIVNFFRRHLIGSTPGVCSSCW